jgi:hypothetical protein
VIAEFPVMLAGAVKVTVAWLVAPLVIEPGITACTLVGAEGTVTAVMATPRLLADEAALVPLPFVAVTVNVYD